MLLDAGSTVKAYMPAAFQPGSKDDGCGIYGTWAPDPKESIHISVLWMM